MDRIEQEKWRDYYGHPIKTGFYLSPKNPDFVCFIRKSNQGLTEILLDNTITYLSARCPEDSSLLLEGKPYNEFYQEYTKKLCPLSNPLGLAQKLKDEAQWIESIQKKLELEKLKKQLEEHNKSKKLN